MPVFSPEESGWEHRSRHWWRLAKDALEDAKILYENERVLACVNSCHAALEKAIKARIATIGDFNDRDMRHNLVYLAKRAGMFDRMPTEMCVFIAQMANAHFTSSYPDDVVFEHSAKMDDHVTMVFNQTNRVFGWIVQDAKEEADKARTTPGESGD